MTPPPDGVVQAAGTVLWRPSRRHGVLIALVHRPRYDDWSLPKGKAEPGELAPVTAARETVEETGFTTAIGRSLTTVSYRTSAGPKVVQYFTGRCLTGEFTPNKEVDRLEWLPPAKARDLMTYEFDRAVLNTFGLEDPALPGVLLVRHARAGSRDSWDGRDADRPLDGKGRRQSAALVPVLRAFCPTAVHTAPLERCWATVDPTARALSLPVTPQPALSEEAYRDDPAGARRVIVELATSAAPGNTVVACSQGGVIPGVIKSLAGRSGVPIGAVGTPKAASWYLCFEGRRLIQADAYPAPSV
ncbi:NUDIX domain-containing protein [Nakamurella flava]|uniref:NUDIX domain-containing protein n=1 Tax=Nakamurella flava TaxID=2576308 RepID=A0A4U6QLJ1_9ACTN|nr:NUDIX hydrolase [Nakamurella flava]TKV61430.1 NUDIX domain-containing protein [Nakamurella flava]